MTDASLATVQRASALAASAPHPIGRALYEQQAAHQLALVLQKEMGVRRALALSSPADPGYLHQHLVMLARNGRVPRDFGTWATSNHRGFSVRISNGFVWVDLPVTSTRRRSQRCDACFAYDPTGWESAARTALLRLRGMARNA